jgi:hypothetical protein
MNRKNEHVRLALSSLFLCISVLGCGAAGSDALDERGSSSAALSSNSQGGNGKGSVSDRLGGFPGILSFLENQVVPAELADPEIAPFFAHLTESPGDIEQCLAMLLDHDLGGRSPGSGAVLPDGHQCRSSMSNIHRGLNIPDGIVDKFILIVGQQATIAGVAPADIQQVADRLNTYRGGVRNK